jgi:hypothetical protein
MQQKALIALAPWASRQQIRSIHRHHNKNRLINGMYYMPCFVMLALFVATTKIHFEEQEAVAETKQQSKRFGCFVLHLLFVMEFLPTSIPRAVYFS